MARSRPWSAAPARAPFLALLVAVLAAGLTPGSTAAQEEPEVIHLPQQPPTSVAPPTSPEAADRAPLNVEEVLGELWFRRKTYLEAGDQASAEKQVALMRDVVRREGVLNADDLAGAFLMDGTRLLDAGNAPRAIQSFHLAREFAPDRPYSAFAVARALWIGEHDFWGALTAAGQGVRILLRNPAARSAYLGNLALILLCGSALLATLWCLITAFRTARLVQHDFYEARARSLSEGAAQNVAWILWFLPSLLWLTGWWVLVYWLALGTVYLKRSERAVSLLSCLCLLAVLPTVGWITRQSAVTTDPAGRFLLEAARGGNDPERIAALEKMATEHPEEPLYRFLLAQAYHAGGSIEAALQEYRQVQKEDAGNAYAWINSGNIFFEKGQYAQAAEEYRRATEANPRSALAFFNLHLAYQAALRLEDSDAAFRQARQVDNALVTSILSTGGDDGRRLPLEARYSAEDVLQRLLKGPRWGWSAPLSAEFHSPLTLAAGFGFLACLLLPWAGNRWNLGAAQRCRKCGQPFCRRCQVGMRKEDGYCTACRHLYILKDPITPRIREERQALVATHERWQWISRRLVSVVLPGVGQIQGGRTLLGIFLVWIACLSVATLTLSGKLLVFARVGAAHPGSWTRITALAAIAFAWLAGNVLSFDRRG